MVDRTAFDKIMQAGGHVSVNTGGVPDANAIDISKIDADEAMDSASCKGRVEGTRRAKAMVAKMDEPGFGNCTNTGAAERLKKI